MNKKMSFKELINSEVPVLVDFSAEWCGPCQALMPIVDELAGTYEGKVKIVKVNVDDSPELAQKFGVLSIPTLVFLGSNGSARIASECAAL